MKNLFLLLISLFFALNLWSQDKDTVFDIRISTSYGDFTIHHRYSNIQQIESRTSYGNFVFNKLDDAIIEEAEKAKVTSDKVVVKVEVSPKGEILGFVISKPGQLSSVNTFVQKAFDELVINAKGKMIFSPNDTGENKTMNIPVKFQL